MVFYWFWIKDKFFTLHKVKKGLAPMHLFCLVLFHNPSPESCSLRCSLTLLRQLFPASETLHPLFPIAKKPFLPHFYLLSPTPPVSLRFIFPFTILIWNLGPSPDLEKISALPPPNFLRLSEECLPVVVVACHLLCELQLWASPLLLPCCPCFFGFL